MVKYCEGELDPAAVGQLPPSLQLEVLTKHREQQAQLNRARFQEASKSAEGFSSLQMSSYIKQTELRRKMEAVRASSGNGSGNRMASKAGGHFVLEDHAEGVFLDLLAPYAPCAVPACARTGDTTSARNNVVRGPPWY